MLTHIARNWWMLLIRGIVAVVFGILALVWPPGITFLALTILFGAYALVDGVVALAVLLFLIGAWAIVTGIFEIVQAVEMRRAIANEWLLLLSGVASVIFGVLIFFFPAAGLVAVVWLVAIYAIIFGVMLIGLSLRLRQLHERTKARETLTPA